MLPVKSLDITHKLVDKADILFDSADILFDTDNTDNSTDVINYETFEYFTDVSLLVFIKLSKLIDK
jgi:hypothetical protein